MRPLALHAPADSGTGLGRRSIALRSLRRNPLRSVGIAAAMAVMAGSLFAIAVALQAVSSRVGLGAARLGADIVVTPRPVAADSDAGTTSVAAPGRYLDYAVVQRVKEVEVIVPQYRGRPPLRMLGVATASAQLAVLLRDPSPAGPPGLRVVGFEPDSDLSVLPWLERPLRRPLGPGEAILGHALTRPPADTVDLAGDRLAVVGVLARTGTEEMDRSVFVALPTAWRLLGRATKTYASNATRSGMGLSGHAVNPSLEARAPPSLASHGPARPIPDRAGRRGSANEGMDSPEAIAQSPDRLALPVTSVLVRARPEAGVQRVANFIRSTIPEVEATVSHEAVTALGTQLRASVGNMAVIAGLIWLTTLLLVASAFAVILRERQREIGLFRAMGATRSDIAALVAGEVVTVCTAGGVIGLAVGLGALTAIDRVVDAGPGIPFDWPAVGPVLGLGLLCLAAAPVTGLLAALAPALRAVTLEPHLAIHDAR